MRIVWCAREDSNLRPLPPQGEKPRPAKPDRVVWSAVLTGKGARQVPPGPLVTMLSSCEWSQIGPREAGPEQCVASFRQHSRSALLSQPSPVDRTPFASPPLMRVQPVDLRSSGPRSEPGRASPGCCAGASCCIRSASPRSAPAPPAACRTVRWPGVRRAADRVWVETAAHPFLCEFGGVFGARVLGARRRGQAVCYVVDGGRISQAAERTTQGRRCCTDVEVPHPDVLTLEFAAASGASQKR